MRTNNPSDHATIEEWISQAAAEIEQTSPGLYLSAQGHTDGNFRVTRIYGRFDPCPSWTFCMAIQTDMQHLAEVPIDLLLDKLAKNTKPVATGHIDLTAVSLRTPQWKTSLYCLHEAQAPFQQQVRGTGYDHVSFKAELRRALRACISRIPGYVCLFLQLPNQEALSHS
jgi:hypothetical protein